MSIEALYPIIKPSLNLDFASTKTLDPRITFTRASTGTYYDGVTTAVAEQNLIIYSQDFTPPNWAKSSVTITGDATTAPDTTTTADTITAVAATAPHYTSQAATVAGANNTFTISCFVKTNTAQYAYVSLTTNSPPTYWATAVVDLTGGTITQTTNGAGVSGVSSSITSIGSGWYRVAVTGTLGSTINNPGIIIGVADSATPSITNYGIYTWTAVGTEAIYAWGAQVEQRSSVTAYTITYPQPVTNYIPVLRTAAAGQPRFDHGTQNRLGTELVSNGNFDSGTTTGWSTINATLSVVNGALRVTRTNVNGQARYVAITVEVGKTYAYSGFLVNRTSAGSALFFQLGTNAGGSQYVNQTIPAGTLSATASGYFTATTTEVYITLYSPAASGYEDWDYITIREVVSFNIGVSLGLLVEEQRTNLTTYSEDFSNAVWTKQQSTISANSAVAPDGTQTADKLVEDTSVSNFHGVSGTVITTVSGTSYTQSVYAKASERDWIRLLFSAAGFGGSLVAFFNVRTGVLGTVSAGVTASIESVGNGWFRCKATATATAAGNYALGVLLGSADNTVFYTGNGYSGVFIWGAQLEAGSFATSYIPTVASQVTRSADLATITGTNFTQWYNTAEGNFVADWKGGRSSTATYDYRVGPVSIVGSNAMFWMALNGDGGSMTTWFGGSAPAFSFATPNFVSEGGKMAVSYGSLGILQAAGGAVDTNDTSIPTMPILPNINIGARGGYPINGTVKRVSYYPYRQASTQTQALTS